MLHRLVRPGSNVQTTENDFDTGGTKSVCQHICILYLGRVRGNCDDIVIAWQPIKPRKILDLEVVQINVAWGHASQGQQS